MYGLTQRTYTSLALIASLYVNPCCFCVRTTLHAHNWQQQFGKHELDNQPDPQELNRQNIFIDKRFLQLSATELTFATLHHRPLEKSRATSKL
jgi:hypothetical protein